MLSVIHPSSNQHLGVFPSNSSSYHGYSVQQNQINSNTAYDINYYDKKWLLQQQLLQQQQEQVQQQQQYPSSWSQASYLFHSVHSQYNNKYSNGFDNAANSVCVNTTNENNSQSSSSRLPSITQSNSYGGGCYTPNHSQTKSSSPTTSNTIAPINNGTLIAKDYSKPLFVDCSIEYELPNAPKVPKNSEPILMIHPAYRVHKTAKRTLPSSSSSKQKKSLTSSNRIVQERAPAPLVSLYPPVSNNGSVHIPSSSKGHKRAYSQLSSSNFISNTGAFTQINPYQAINANNPYNCCNCYEQTAAKRCCISAPNNFEEFKRQQHLMHLQAQFSLYIRNGGESFW
uniref:Centrosomal and chromosomal factorlike [Ceratitis capitata] n=1 Tax=Lepeophtheirus salmonis TaxID=72036 RepID=A0A0K2TNM1_LEPSM